MEMEQAQLSIKKTSCFGWNILYVEVCQVTQSKSKTQKQEVSTVSSIVLLLTLIGHNMVFIVCFLFWAGPT